MFDRLDTDELIDRYTLTGAVKLYGSTLPGLWRRMLRLGHRGRPYPIEWIAWNHVTRRHELKSPNGTVVEVWLDDVWLAKIKGDDKPPAQIGFENILVADPAFTAAVLLYLLRFLHDPLKRHLFLNRLRG